MILQGLSIEYGGAGERESQSILFILQYLLCLSTNTQKGLFFHLHDLLSAVDRREQLAADFRSNLVVEVLLQQTLQSLLLVGGDLRLVALSKRQQTLVYTPLTALPDATTQATRARPPQTTRSGSPDRPAPRTGESTSCSAAPS